MIEFDIRITIRIQDVLAFARIIVIISAALN